MPRTNNTDTNSDANNKQPIMDNSSQNVKKPATTNKKQAPINIKIPSARERAKEFDEARRHDAESNEL